MADCPACGKGRLVLQVETIARRPVQYRRCTHCGCYLTTVNDARINAHD